MSTASMLLLALLLLLGFVDKTLTVETSFEMEEYKLQKQALDQAYYNLKNSKSKCKLTLIRPGSVATQPYNTAGKDSADVDVWCQAVVDMWDRCNKDNLSLQEMSIGHGS